MVTKCHSIVCLPSLCQPHPLTSPLTLFLNVPPHWPAAVSHQCHPLVQCLSKRSPPRSSHNGLLPPLNGHLPGLTEITFSRGTRDLAHELCQAVPWRALQDWCTAYCSCGVISDISGRSEWGKDYRGPGLDLETFNALVGSMVLDVMALFPGKKERDRKARFQLGTRHRPRHSNGHTCCDTDDCGSCGSCKGNGGSAGHDQRIIPTVLIRTVGSSRLRASMSTRPATACACACDSAKP